MPTPERPNGLAALLLSLLSACAVTGSAMRRAVVECGGAPLPAGWAMPSMRSMGGYLKGAGLNVLGLDFGGEGTAWL